MIPKTNPKRPPMNRRIFLKGVAGACLAAPFLSSVHEQWAKAQGVAATPPKRLVIFYTHNGCLTTRWFPTNENGALQASDLTGTYLEPLSSKVNKLLIPRGFRSMNSYAVGQSIDPHDQACGSKLTCAYISTESNRYATAESLDHTIAKQINPGDKTPLVLSVGAPSTLIKEVISFSAPNTAFPSNVNPQSVYKLLSGVVMGGSSGTTTGSTGSTGTTQADYMVQRGKSVIDLVSDDLQSYKRLNMSKSDQDRVDTWLSLLRETETGMQDPAMQAACNSTTQTTLGISNDALTAASPTGSITAGNVLGPKGTADGDANLATSFTKGGDMMMNLTALSMACDINRTFVFLYPGYVIYKWDGMNNTKEHHGLSHRTGDFTVGGNCFADVLTLIAQIDTWLAGKFTRLVETFDSLPEGDGTLLDNTATMWLPELSDGAAHNLNNLPIIIAGSAGGYLKQGAIVNVEGKGTIGKGNSEGSCQNGGTIGNTGSSGGNFPINKLYVTLMNAVGCKAADGGPVTTFGVFDGNKDTDGIKNPGEVTALKAS
jgi:hypothetical protein